MAQSDFRQVLMWRYIHYAFKNAAEMKRAYKAMLRQLLKRNVLAKILKNILFSIFNSAQVKLF